MIGSLLIADKAPPLLVSVIIPTYNRQDFIAESINSVLVQTYTNLEILVVDDGSTDNTRSIIENISDSRLHYIYQPNRGRSNARNHALSRATGKFITFLDSDDLYLPNKIELQVNYLIKNVGTKVVYTSAYCINEKGEMLSEKYIASVSGWIYKDVAFFRPVTITLPTVMTYREVIDDVGFFDETMHRFEDTDMWRRISKSYRIDAMSEYTCLLRTHDNNSLLNQDPDYILSALEYYAKKIINEDSEIDLATRNKGLAGLYGYYAAALMSIPKFSNQAITLIHISEIYKTGSSGYVLSPKIEDVHCLKFMCDKIRIIFHLFYCKIKRLSVKN